MIKLTLVLMKNFDKLSTIMMNNYLIKNFLGWNKHCQVNTCLKKPCEDGSSTAKMNISLDQKLLRME